MVAGAARRHFIACDARSDQALRGDDVVISLRRRVKMQCLRGICDQQTVTIDE
jgi:hypothetical protein